jgi:hypothetical protein
LTVVSENERAEAGLRVVEPVWYESEVSSDRSHAEYRWLAAILAVLSAGVLFYSQQTTLDWDEGFHLVAASLIRAGRQPYVDFCFPQPLLHAYWNALWLQVFGSGWRAPHVIAALFTSGAIVLTADFVFRRVTYRRLTAAIAAALFLGLNSIVVEFGTKAQAYGAGTFLIVAAFRLTAGRPGSTRAFFAGGLAGAAASSTLLTAPACVVLVLWTVWQRRFAHVVVFVAGAVVGLLPILLSLLHDPYLAWFNLVDYHVFFRHVGWTGATENDLQVLTSWVDSGQALLLGLFAVAGMILVRRSDKIPLQKAEFYLAAAMAVALGAEAATAHPTFPQYFIFVIPFLSMLAAVGFDEVAARLSLSPALTLPVLTALLALSLTNSLTALVENNNTWDGMEALARKVKQVTPANATILADPPVYFALGLPVPSGMEFPASHRLELPAAEAARLHIVPQSQLERRVRAGEFATVETCKDDEDEIQAMHLPSLYSQSAALAGCTVYWGFK